MVRFLKRVGGVCISLIGAFGMLYAALGLFDSMAAQSGFDSPVAPIVIGIISLIITVSGWAIAASAND